MSSVTLVVPDAHVGPGQKLDRFNRLGQLIVDRRPDRIVTMGDFVTLESLSNWDLNKSGVMEGRRYKADIASAVEALARMTGPLQAVQDKQRRLREKIYRPRLVYIKGNHEDRLDRYTETKPELKEHLNLEEDLQLMDFGFTDVVPYKEYIEIDGVLMTHAPLGGSAQPVSGKMAVHRAAEMMSKSLVFGHTHRKEGVNYYRHGAENINQILTCGCFFEDDPDYAYGGLNSYWRGVMLLNHFSEGRFDVEEISLERLGMMYG